MSTHNVCSHSILQGALTIAGIIIHNSCQLVYVHVHVHVHVCMYTYTYMYMYVASSEDVC